jgi:hypothetical protein
MDELRAATGDAGSSHVCAASWSTGGASGGFAPTKAGSGRGEAVVLGAVGVVAPPPQPPRRPVAAANAAANNEARMIRQTPGDSRSHRDDM